MKALFRLIASLFFRPPILQVAALCVRGHKNAREVLLIRSLDRNRWILPKGWPMRGKTLAEAAAVEAWEEAGVKGTPGPAIGTYGSFKRRANGVRQRSTVEVFVLHVQNHEKDFPEAGLRKARWFPATVAVGKLREADLRALIVDYLSQGC